MIHDGYTRHITINGQKISYRPCVQEDRFLFRWEAAFFDPLTQQKICTEFVRTHVVHSSVYLSELPDEDFKILFLAIQGLVPDDSGSRWADIEQLWRINLEEGVRLLVQHPEVATRDCEMCQKWWYNSTGQIIRDNSGKPQERVGDTPCRVIGLGCPKGTPENQRGLNPANKAAYAHFLKCDAIGLFPEDGVVAKNARVIRAILRESDMIRQRKERMTRKR